MLERRNRIGRGETSPAWSTLLAGIDDAHAALASARELLDTALTHLDETSRELRRYLDELTSAPDELASASKRASIA